MADPKITFKLELDDSQINSQLNSVVQKISQLNRGQNVSVHVNADISGAQSGMKTVTSEMNTLNGAQAEVNIDADISAAQSDMDTVETDLNTLDGSSAEVNVTADISDAQSGTDEVTSDMNALDGMTSTVNVNADISNAQSAIDTVESELNALDGREANVTVNTTTNGSSSDGSSSSSSDSSSSGNSILSSAGSLVKTIFKEGSEYETSRAKASTLMPEGTDLNEWDSIVSELSSKYGQPASSYNEAAYSMLSAGQSYENLPELLDLSSQLAVGGFTDVETAAGLLAKMGNAYGSTDYQQMANNALLTQNYGIIDVGPAARVMPQVNSVAANANVSMANLMATMAAITHAGVQPEQAGTQVRALINELDKTGQTGQETLGKTDLAKQWAKDTGNKAKNVKISDLMDAGYTMGDIARSLGDYSEAKGVTFSDMFSSQEAGAAIANILSSDQGATFDSAYQDMINGVDAVTPAFETMADTTSFTMDQIMTQFQNAGIELFTALAPSIAKFLDVLTSDDFKKTLSSIIDKITSWLESGGLEKFVDAIITASEWLLEVFNGDRSLSEFFEGIASAIVNALINVLPDSIKKLLGVYVPENVDGEGSEGPSMKEKTQQEYADQFYNLVKSGKLSGIEGVDLTSLQGIKEAMSNEEFRTRLAENGINVSKDASGTYDANNITDANEWLRLSMQDLQYILPRYSSQEEAKAHGVGNPLTDPESGKLPLLTEIEDFWKQYLEPTELPEVYLPPDSSNGSKTGGVASEDSSIGRNGKLVVEDASSLEKTYGRTFRDDDIMPGGSSLIVSSGKSANTEGMQGAVDQMSNAMSTAADTTTTTATNATKVSGALGKLATAVSSAIRRCNTVGSSGGGTDTDGNKSVGMSYVPFDGYVATLHKGEAVLTAAQASTYRMGGGTSVSGIDYTALASAMAGMTMTMDSRTVGRIVEKSVSQAQGARVARTTRGVRS